MHRVVMTDRRDAGEQVLQAADPDAIVQRVGLVTASAGSLSNRG